MEKELLNGGKELLLKDLCARLPYGVKCNISRKNTTWVKSRTIDSTLDCHWLTEVQHDFYEIKPYLFPLSSMTGAHRAELFNLRIPIEHPLQDSLCEIDFYHRYHFDYRGLIPKGLALDATGLNIY